MCYFTWGGAFLNDKIRRKVKKNSNSFWLNWKIKTILERISKIKGGLWH